MRISESRTGDEIFIDETVLRVDQYQVTSATPIIADGSEGKPQVIFTFIGRDAITLMPLTYVVAIPATATPELTVEVMKATEAVWRRML